MYIAFDIGGTKTKIIAFETLTPTSQVASLEIPSSELQKYQIALEKLKDTALEIAGPIHIDGVGIASTPQFELARYQQEAQAYGVLQLLAPGRTLVNMNYY